MGAHEMFARYPLLDALCQRRSRRFGLGMRIDGGPLNFKSQHSPVPLSEDEEAVLAFAACGITGPALADLSYADGQGGNIMAGLTGRTVASGDGIQTVALAVINDEAAYVLRRPSEFPTPELAELVELARRSLFTELYRRVRVQVAARRVKPPLDPLFNVNVNRWSLYAPGTTYFLPINDVTLMYINGLLELFNESTGAFVVDERACFRPAGLKRFAKSRGGHLADHPNAGRVLTIANLELLVAEVVTIEQGMMLQNLSLASQAMGIGGFPNFAAHPFGWFEALGFRMGQLPASRYLGAGWITSWLMWLTRRNSAIPFPLGLEIDGEMVLRPFCPPHFSTMQDAVRAVVDLKFGREGLLRGGIVRGAWKEPAEVANQIPKISDAAVAATIAYCEYVHARYGRFPAYLAPYRTVLGYQATHVDPEFYDRFYHPEALSQTQRDHFANWHADK